MSGSRTAPTGTPVVEVRDLHVGYRRHRTVRAAVNGVDLRIVPGETVAVVGGSGSGKTTVAQTILGLLPPAGVVTSGQVIIEGEDVTHAGDRVLRQIRGSVVGLVPQDPTVGLNPTQRIGAQVAEAVRHRGVGGRSVSAEVVEALTDAGLPDAAVRARQYPHELSGGLRQRVLIAIALAGHPRLIIADEPTSALDVTVQRRILDHLEGLVADRGIALLMITHDLGVAADRAHRVVVLDQGRVVETGPSRQVLLHPAAPETRRLIDDAPGLTSVGPVGPVGPVDVDREPGARAADQPPALLSVEGISKSFALPRLAGGARSVRAVDDVSLVARRGQTLALVGESGSGKTTTLRVALGLEAPDTGRVVFDGEEVTRRSWGALRPLRARFQLVQQNPFSALDPRCTVARCITEPLVALRLADRAARRRRAEELVEQVGLGTSYLGRYPAELSGGQRQRVAIARALAAHPDLVFLDEPVSALDVSVQAQILRLLGELQTHLGLTYVLVSHDLAVVAQLAHHIAVLKDGAVVEQGPATEVLRAPREAYTRELLDAVPGRR
ncbi:MAG: dipeptide ABC transporter ATP-binding protein, partial [Janthinobacterium lividum]